MNRVVDVKEEATQGAVDMTDAKYWINLLLSFFMTGVAYLVIPIILSFTLRLTKRRSILVIVILNGIAAFIGFRIFEYAAGVRVSANTSPAFLWSFVAYSLMLKLANRHSDASKSKPPRYFTVTSSEGKEWVISGLKANVAVALIITSLCATSYYWWYNYDASVYKSARINELSVEIESLSEENRKAESENSSLKDDNSSLKAENSSLDVKNRLLSTDNIRLTIQNSDYYSKAWFLDTYIVLVTTTGSKYHRYDCQYVKDSSFYAFNIETAQVRGYEPCSVCYK